MEVILLRHSIAEGNAERRFLGRTDAPLTAEGITLAKERAREMPKVECVYVSPMTRAKETAAILWPDIPAAECAGLREVDFGMLENRTHGELAGDASYEAWLQAGGGEGYPGGESFFGFEERVREAFAGILKDAERKGKERIAIVTHGGVIMKIAVVYPAGKAAHETFCAANCGGYRMTIKTEKDCAECTDIVPLFDDE